jgi:hypothetical protein
MDHDPEHELYPLHFPNSGNAHNNNTNPGNSNGHPHPHHPGGLLPYHHTPPPSHHGFQQEILSPTHHQFMEQHHIHAPHHGSGSHYHGSSADLQTAAQTQEHELLMNRHLNSHTSHLQSPHHQHHPYQQHYPQQHQQQSQQSQQSYYYHQQQPSKQYTDPNSDPATPGSTAASTLTSGSTASTPLAQPASGLPYQGNDYPYVNSGSALTHVHRHASPTASFHAPATPMTPTSKPLSQGRPKRDRTRCRIGPQTASKCGTNVGIAWLADWKNSMCKADLLLDTTSLVSIEPKTGGSPLIPETVTS